MPMWLNWQSSWFVISRLSVRVRSSACVNKYGRIPEWPKGTDCKSAATCFGGSNPPPPRLSERKDSRNGKSGSRSANKKLIFNRRAQIAQLVEQRTENPRVAGSIPALGMEISYFICGCSSMVEHQPSKLDTWVRFPSPALLFSAGVLCSRRFRLFCDLITDRRQKTR